MRRHVAGHDRCAFWTKLGRTFTGPGYGDAPSRMSSSPSGSSRDELKRILAAAYPMTGQDTIQQWAGTLIRFAFTAKAGDLVLHPNRERGTVSLGRVVGDYFWQDDGAVDRHCRRVHWLRTGLRRDRLSDDARRAASGRAAFFSIKSAVEELEALATGIASAA